MARCARTCTRIQGKAVYALDTGGLGIQNRGKPGKSFATNTTVSNCERCSSIGQQQLLFGGQAGVGRQKCAAGQPTRQDKGHRRGGTTTATWTCHSKASDLSDEIVLAEEPKHLQFAAAAAAAAAELNWPRALAGPAETPTARGRSAEARGAGRCSGHVPVHSPPLRPSAAAALPGHSSLQPAVYHTRTQSKPPSPPLMRAAGSAGAGGRSGAWRCTTSEGGARLGVAGAAGPGAFVGVLSEQLDLWARRSQKRALQDNVYPALELLFPGFLHVSIHKGPGCAAAARIVPVR